MRHEYYGAYGYLWNCVGTALEWPWNLELRWNCLGTAFGTTAKARTFLFEYLYTYGLPTVLPVSEDRTYTGTQTKKSWP